MVQGTTAPFISLGVPPTQFRLWQVFCADWTLAGLLAQTATRTQAIAQIPIWAPASGTSQLVGGWTTAMADGAVTPASIVAVRADTGQYVWQVPADAPAQFLVRAEAIDLAGNVGRVKTAHPVLLDSRVPSVSIINAEANAGH